MYMWIVTNPCHTVHNILYHIIHIALQKTIIVYQWYQSHIILYKTGQTFFTSCISIVPCITKTYGIKTQ